MKDTLIDEREEVVITAFPAKFSYQPEQSHLHAPVCVNEGNLCDDDHCYCTNEEVIKGARVMFVGWVDQLEAVLKNYHGYGN